MRHSSWTLMLAAGMILAIAQPPAAAPPGAANDHPDKAYVVDGSVVHDVGTLWLNVTNWGLLGSQYSSNTTYSDAPSARWPESGGVDHLWAAGLWVGGIVGGEARVSTGQYETEIRATTAPADTIYSLSWQTPAATRFPLGDPDDDGDGLEDEDPFNGVDDDGDGLIDEDAAGVSDQHFRAEMYDNTLEAQQAFPDHRPLGLKIVQETYQWLTPEIADFVGVDYTLINIGDQTISGLYAGMFSDFDIDDPSGAGEAEDDRVGFASATVEAFPGVPVDVEVAYMFEGDGATVSGHVGWIAVGHPIHAYHWFSGQLPYDQGGDPTNDSQRYELLSTATIDPPTAELADHRLLLSVEPAPQLAPGEAITASFALVAGADLDELLRNAARAKLVYQGEAFDRDGDPGNGAEFVVRWLGPEEIAVPVEHPAGPDGDGQTPAAGAISLGTAPNPFNPSLEISARLPHAGAVRVSVVDLRGREVRVLHDGAMAAGQASWRWDGRDGRGRQQASGVYLVRLETAERVLERAVTLVK
jgi:hypothetical protein